MKAPVLYMIPMSALLLCGALGAASAPKAKAAPGMAPTPVPYAVPNLSAMKMFMGTWHCTQPLRGKIRPDTGTTTMALDGQWMMTRDVAPPFDKYRTKSQVTNSYMTYNPINKMWVTVSVDNFGGYMVTSSPGWSGNTIRTTIKMANDGSTGYDVLTKLSATKTTDHFVGTDAKGKVTTGTITCTKTG